MSNSETRRARAGRALLVVAALITIIAPVLLDAVVFAAEHMQNPAWPPHAKLHTAILFLFGVAVGVAALVCLCARPVTDRFAMTLGAFLATAFWLSLSVAGFWPGTSWSAGDDPEPYPLGLPPNVLTALIVVAVAVAGLALVLHGPRTTTSDSGPAGARVGLS
jgi:hypothetical protein